jgi:hypothetical protein
VKKPVANLSASVRQRLLNLATDLLRQWMPLHCRSGGHRGALAPSSGDRHPPHGLVVPGRVRVGGQHAVLARKVGVSDEEIARVKGGPEAEGWTELEAAVLRAADELHSDACITDDTWAVLAAHLNERQLIELPMLVGQYHIVSFTLNTLGIQREPGLGGFNG